MIKILFLIHDLCEGGAEKVLVNLVNNMDRTKYDITVQTLFDVGTNKQFLKPDIHYKTWCKYMFRGNSHVMKLFSPSFLYKAIVKEEYDIVVAYLEGPSARIISGCPYGLSKKVMWMHGEQKNYKNASRGFRGMSEAISCAENFDKIVCVSNTVREDFNTLFGIEDTVTVLYNTNETDTILKKAKEVVDDIVFETDKINICSVGRLIPIKGYERLIKVHKRLIEDGYPVHTRILGIGSEQIKLKKEIEQQGLADSFELLGYKTNPYKYVKNSDLFVCTSYAEGFSTAATEALIVGTPVLTTLVSGMEEMLGGNEYGVIVDNNDDAIYEGVKSLLDDKDKLAFYSKQAELRGRDFSTEKTVQAVQDMFEELFEKRQKRR